MSFRIEVDEGAVRLYQQRKEDGIKYEWYVEVDASTVDLFRRVCDAALPAKRARKAVQTSDRFEDFWKVYPKRTAKADALKAWSSKGCDANADAIIRHVEQMAASRQWQEQGGRYIPNASTYLNGLRWQDDAEQADDIGVIL